MYHADLRIAHWITVFLVAFQFLTGEGMSRGFDADMSKSASGTGTGYVHAAIGLGILAVMLWRLTRRRATALPPPAEPAPLSRVVRATHLGFYVFLIAMPIAGLLALMTGAEWLGTLHGLASKALWLMILAHLSGAALHLMARDGVANRMLGHEAQG